MQFYFKTQFNFLNNNIPVHTYRPSQRLEVTFALGSECHILFLIISCVFAFAYYKVCGHTTCIWHIVIFLDDNWDIL